MVLYAQPAITGFQAKMPHPHACPLRGGHIKVHLTKQRRQLRGQGWASPQLPKHYSHLYTSKTLLAASPKPDASTEAVRAECFKAGIPDEVVTKVLQQYSAYLRWPIDTKLRPALTVWVQQLGSQQLSHRLDQDPRLLHRSPEECNDVYLWLADVRVDTKKVQRQTPRVMTRQLKHVQSTVWAIQEALQLTDEQLPAFLNKHTRSLVYSPERVVGTLQTVAKLLAVPVASKEMREVVMVCGQQLFAIDAVELHHRVSFFCEEFNGGQHAARAAFKQNVYVVSAEMMSARATELKAMLGWTEDEVKQRLGTTPAILARKPTTVANNIQKLQAHNFSPTQALAIYASRPSIAGYDWSSPSNVQKLMYLMLVLQHSTAELASSPVPLATSLECAIGPRSEFVYRSKGITPDTPLGQSGLSRYVYHYSETRFAAKFNNLSASPPLAYDENFTPHWSQRWSFLTHEMGLSIADISACRALLCYILAQYSRPSLALLGFVGSC